MKTSDVVGHTATNWTVMAEDVLGANGIVTIVPVNGHGVICRIPSNDKTPAERDAVANLIAAAPELLATLKALLSSEESPHSETVRYLAREDARAAIAKATGAQP